MPNENSMDLDPELTNIMLKLPKLTDIEEMLIARARIAMKVRQLSKGRTCYQGNTTNIEQYMVSMINKLSSSPWDFYMLVARKNNPNNPDGYKDLKINKTNTLIWLLWLK